MIVETKLDHVNVVLAAYRFVITLFGRGAVEFTTVPGIMRTERDLSPVSGINCGGTTLAS